jgi:hypothetical protein
MLLKTGGAGVSSPSILSTRNENTGVSVKTLVVHGRASKDRVLIVVVKKQRNTCNLPAEFLRRTGCSGQAR